MIWLVAILAGVLTGFVLAINMLGRDPVIYGRILKADCFKAIRLFLKKRT